MATVTLVNRTKRPPRMLVFNLTRQVDSVRVENRTTEESRDGTRRTRVSAKLVPGALRIPARSSVDVDDAVLGCPDVAAGIDRREVVVVRSAEPAKPAGPAAASPPAAVRLPVNANDEKANDDERPRRRRGG